MISLIHKDLMKESNEYVIVAKSLILFLLCRRSLFQTLHSYKVVDMIPNCVNGISLICLRQFNDRLS